MKFRDRAVAAPLKRIGSGWCERQLPQFRDRAVAAPLKRDQFPCGPQSCCRNSATARSLRIEATANTLISVLLLGHIGSQLDITSGRCGHQDKRIEMARTSSRAISLATMA